MRGSVRSGVAWGHAGESVSHAVRRGLALREASFHSRNFRGMLRLQLNILLACLTQKSQEDVSVCAGVDSFFDVCRVHMVGRDDVLVVATHVRLEETRLRLRIKPAAKSAIARRGLDLR